MAEGTVHGQQAANQAALAFNYQAAPRGPLELEVLQYDAGPNWMDWNVPSVSHLGMHCTSEELEQWRTFFEAEGVRVVQEVLTINHTNPAIAGKRNYQYVIFGTRGILGVDIKLIVRINAP
jgi:hypothetical protein